MRKSAELLLTIMHSQCGFTPNKPLKTHKTQRVTICDVERVDEFICRSCTGIKASFKVGLTVKVGLKGGMIHTPLQPHLKAGFKGTVSRDFLLLVFFRESSSPKPPIIALGSFRIISKIRGDIRQSRCTTGIYDTGDKFCHQNNWCCWYRWQGATGINNTGGKFAIGVNDTSGK